MMDARGPVQPPDKHKAIHSIAGAMKDRRRRPGGVNGSQSKFLIGIWPISQNQPETPPFQHAQDWLAMDRLLVFGSGLGSLLETRNDAGVITGEIDDTN
jgi:hypothetical protein